MVRKILKNYRGPLGMSNHSNRIEWVKENLQAIPEGAKILDAGAGEQQYKKYCSHLTYVSQDFGEYEGEGDGSALQTGTWDTSGINIVCDIIDIPEPDASYDAILCTEVIEHIPEPHKAFEEFYRLLKPGGVLLLTAPFNSLTHYAPYHFCTGFSKYYYQHHLSKEKGFDLVETTPNGHYSDYMSQEIRRIETLYGKSPLFLRLCSSYILRYLWKNQDHKNASSDLLTMGFHVKAVKL